MAMKRKAERVDRLRKQAKKAKDDRLYRALGAWSRLTRTRQAQFASEIVETRQEELRLAYVDVVCVGHGLRTSTKDGTVSREPCVTFMVRRKWRKSPRSQRVLARSLPEWLYHFGTDRAGKRTQALTENNLIKGEFRWHKSRRCLL